MTIDTLVLGPLETNCYVLRDDGDCWVVDPGMEPGSLLAFLEAASAAVSRIVLTHGHGDHIAGVEAVKGMFPSAIITCPAGDEDMLTDPEANMSAPFGFAVCSPPAEELLRPAQTLRLGSAEWLVLDTSGHTRGGISLYCASGQVVLTGDALFAGSIGRTDIPGGSAARLLKNIRENLLTLPGPTQVLPGHGPRSTIDVEKRTNPLLLGN